MMMGLRVRVIHDFRRVDDQLADQLLLEEKLKRIVNSRLGRFGVARIHARQDLIGGKMFPPREQCVRDLDALMRRRNPLAAQQFCDGFPVMRWKVRRGSFEASIWTLSNSSWRPRLTGEPNRRQPDRAGKREGTVSCRPLVQIAVRRLTDGP